MKRNEAEQSKRQTKDNKTEIQVQAVFEMLKGVIQHKR